MTSNAVVDCLCPGLQNEVENVRYLPTGSTLLNLACAGKIKGGFPIGKYCLLVGDASAGKTFLAMSCLAEACLQESMKDYRLIYDNVEDGCLLDVGRLFHTDLEKRLEPPRMDKRSPVYSSTVEEFYYHVDDACKCGKPFIYVLDSMDALTSEDEETRFDKGKQATRKGKFVPGSYGTGKARKNSEGLRKVMKGLRATNSVLLILAQTRDNLGFGFTNKSRSGGHALRFYATIELWASIVGQIKKSVHGKPRVIGVRVAWKVKKNRVLGSLREVKFEIYPSYGIDDLGSCIDYLIEEGIWKQKGTVVDSAGFCPSCSRSRLIRYIEKKRLTNRLLRLVKGCWNEVEKAGALKRPRRYALAAD